METDILYLADGCSNGSVDFPLGGRGGGRAGAGPAPDGRPPGGGEDGLVLVQLRLELHVLDLQVPDAGQELLRALGLFDTHLGGLLDDLVGYHSH